MLAGGALLASVTAPLTAQADVPAAATADGQPGGMPDSVVLHQAVGQLPVATENRVGYHRVGEFGGWTNADHNGCNTRAEVPLEEAVVAGEPAPRMPSSTRPAG